MLTRYFNHLGSKLNWEFWKLTFVALANSLNLVTAGIDLEILMRVISGETQREHDMRGLSLCAQNKLCGKLGLN